MIRHNIKHKTVLDINQSTEGVTIETKVNKILTTKEPITDGTPVIYMTRKEGVNPDYDIRTDKWDHVVEAMDVVSRAKIEKRTKSVENNNTEPIQGTEQGKNPAA